MKSAIILITALFTTVTAQASTSEQFFTAYQVAQVSGLSKVIANQAHSPQVMADIVAKLQQTDASADKTTSNTTKETYQKQVTEYLNSAQANDYFDSLATDILVNAYSYEQLKALYQLYTSPVMQNALPNEINFQNQQSIQRYLATRKMQQQLDTKTQQILDSVKIVEKTETETAKLTTPEPKKTETPEKTQPIETKKTQQQPTNEPQKEVAKEKE